MKAFRSRIRIGLSACLTGDEVRYNGQGAEDRFVNRELVNYFDFIKVCPEVGIGLGIPRETIRLVKKNDDIRLVNHSGDKDFTDKMLDFSKTTGAKLKDERISGYIFKKSSPSCGAFRVKVYNEEGVTQAQSSVGVFSKYIQEKFPWLPVEEDGRLNDPGLRHNFISRVFAIKYWQENVEDDLSVNSLVEFHKIHKYMLMSHGQVALRKLGRIVANSQKKPVEEMAEEYLALFTEVTRKPAPRSKHANVLFHLMGYFSKKLDDFDRKEVVNVIDKYRRGLIPLVLPINSINHYTNKYQISYLQEQSYLKTLDELCMLNRI